MQVHFDGFVAGDGRVIKFRRRRRRRPQPVRVCVWTQRHAGERRATPQPIAGPAGLTGIRRRRQIHVCSRPPGGRADSVARCLDDRSRACSPPCVRAL